MRNPQHLPDGEGLQRQGKEVRKKRKGNKKKIYTIQGNGVDVRGLTVKERMTLNMIKLRGWL